MTTRALVTPRPEDVPLMEELSDGALQSAVGGRINLRVDGPGKPPPDSHGAGGPLHPGDDRFNIYWPHGYW